MIRLPPRPTLFPYTTLFRSRHQAVNGSVIDGSPECLLRKAAEDLPCILAPLGGLTGGVFREETVEILGPHPMRSEEHTSELQSQSNLVCRLLLEKKK